MNLPLVFVHGWAAHGGYFRDVERQLPDSIKSFCPDLPGHGKNNADQSCHTIEQLAKWLNQYLEDQKMEKVLLCGWSMGAQVALSLLEQFGDDCIAGLVIEDMTPRLLTNHEWELGLDGSFSEIENTEWISSVRKEWYQVCHSSADKLFAYQPGNSERTRDEINELKAWAREQSKLNNKSNNELLADFWDSMSKQDFRPLLPSLELPVLIVSGAKSQLYSTQTGDYFVHNLPNARHHILEYSGHAPHMEQPAAFAKAISDFNAEISSKTTAYATTSDSGSLDTATPGNITSASPDVSTSPSGR